MSIGMSVQNRPTPNPHARNDGTNQTFTFGPTIRCAAMHRRTASGMRSQPTPSRPQQHCTPPCRAPGCTLATPSKWHSPTPCGLQLARMKSWRATTTSTN